MKAKVRKIDLHPEEFLAGIAGEMSPSELGVYWMICLLCYTRGGMIKYDTNWLCQKFKVGKGNRVIPGIVAKLIANGKVVRDGSEIGVRRALDELEIVLRRIRDASENGAKGNEIRWGNGRDSDEDEIAINNQQPVDTESPPAPPYRNSEQSELDIAKSPPDEDARLASPKRKPRKKRPPSTLPTDWRPDAECYQYACSYGLSERQIEMEIERFKNHAEQHDRQAVNWNAAWKNWVLIAIGKNPPTQDRPLEEWERRGWPNVALG